VTAALELIGVHKRFGATEIIRGVDLAIERGETHAIIGPNGAGKSTLFNLISGKFPLSAGRIRLKGLDITDHPTHVINRHGLSRSFQVTNLFHRLSAFENLRCALLWPGGQGYSFWRLCGGLGAINRRAEDMLERLNLSARRDVPAGVLSYAEQRALEIGLAVADVILLDEPTAGMSHSETQQAVALIRDMTRDKTLIMVEHDMNVVFDLAERISVLVYGQVVASDTPERIKANPAVQEAYLGTVAS